MSTQEQSSLNIHLSDTPSVTSRVNKYGDTLLKVSGGECFENIIVNIINRD